MRADDAESGLCRGFASQHKGRHGGAAPHDVVATAVGKPPALAFFEADETALAQTRFRAGDGMPRRRTGVDEVEQAARVGRGVGRKRHGKTVRFGSATAYRIMPRRPL